MTGQARLRLVCRWGLALALALAAAVALPVSAPAQERPRVEVAPRLLRVKGIVSAAYSPDGGQVVWGRDDGMMEIKDTATGRTIRTFVAHGDRVAAVAFSSKRTVLSAMWNEMKLWNAVTGRLIRTTAFSAGTVIAPASVAFSPDGTQLLSGGESDGTVKLWDAETGRLVRAFHHGGPRDETHDGVHITAVAFSPDGARVLTGGFDAKGVKLWDAVTGELLRTFPAGSGSIAGTNSLAFSPDGTRVLIGGHGYMALWDAEPGAKTEAKLWHPMPSPKLVGFSRDGARVLASTIYGLYFWDAATGRHLRDVPSLPPALAVSPVGAGAIGSRDDFASLWDERGRAIHAYSDYALPIGSLAVSPDGKHVLAGGAEATEGGAPRLWETATGRFVSDPSRLSKRPGQRYGGPISIAVYTPDGPRVIVREVLGKVRLWDAVTAERIHTFKGDPIGNIRSFKSPLAVSPNGAYAVSRQGNRLLLWDIATGSVRHVIEAERSHGVRSVAISRDSTRIASGDWNGMVRLWNAGTGRSTGTLDARAEVVSKLGWIERLYRSGKHRVPSRIDALAFSPNGARLLSAQRGRSDSDGTTLKLWNVETGEPIRTFDAYPGKVSWVTFSPDGNYVLSIMGKAPSPPARNDFAGIRLWDQQGRGRRTLHEDATPFGVRGDRVLGLWEAASGLLVRIIRPTSGSVTSAAYSHDGRHIFAASGDGTVNVWESRTGELAATLLAVLAPPSLEEYDAKFGNYEWVTVTPEGYFDASAKGADLLSLVRGLKVSAIDPAAYQVLHRPDLVRAKLDGDPNGKVKAAAAELEAKLQLK